MNAEAEKTLGLLKSNGWSGEYGTKSIYTSLVTLVKNVNSGIDYTPDAAYEKTIGDINCLFDSNTAFSSPKPPAISSNLYCTREVYMFGKPNVEDIFYPTEGL